MKLKIPLLATILLLAICLLAGLVPTGVLAQENNPPMVDFPVPAVPEGTEIEIVREGGDLIVFTNPKNAEVQVQTLLGGNTRTRGENFRVNICTPAECRQDQGNSLFWSSAGLFPQGLPHAVPMTYTIEITGDAASLNLGDDPFDWRPFSLRLEGGIQVNPHRWSIYLPLVSQ